MAKSSAENGKLGCQNGQFGLDSGRSSTVLNRAESARSEDDAPSLGGGLILGIGDAISLEAVRVE